MNLIQQIILWLIVSACRAEIISEALKSDNLASLAEFTMEILSSCYETEVKTVGLAGDSYDALFEMLSTKLSYPVALIGNDTAKDPEDRKSRHKLQLFIVIASSSTQLKQILNQIKTSHWWNHMATYFILDWDHSSLNDECSNAFPFLWTSWQMDILKGFYVCHNRTLERFIYSYNPYTNKAPKPWQHDNTYIGKNNHPWSLLRRDYDVNDEVMCLNLNFDKTNDLGGYEIYSTVKDIPDVWATYVNKIGSNEFGGHAGDFAKAIFNALNANAHLVIHDIKYPGLSDSLGRDIAVDTIIGNSDIVLIPRLHSVVPNYTVSYGFRESGLSILTQYSGQQTQLEKLISVLDRSSRICVCLVAVTTVIFFKYYLQQSLVSSLLNVLRIVANSSLTKMPNNPAARIYLAGVFILVVTITGIYQGQLSSLLTKPKPLPNVKSMRDLADRGYIIHTNKNYPRMYNDPALKGRFVTHDSYDCTQYVLRNSLAACIRRQIDQIQEVSKYKLHISLEMDPKSMYVYTIRDNWPLEERLNFVLAALNEADIPRLILEKDMERTLKISRYHAEQDKIDKFKVIILNELSFAFKFLAIGLTCSILCFILEFIIAKSSR